MEFFRDLLSSKDVRPSFQRISVLKYLVENREHPSVETIFQNLRKEIPGISRTTVYNTIHLLQKNDIITGLKINDNEIRYDYMEHPHTHFQCNSCERIFDVDIGSDLYEVDFIEKHVVLETQVFYKGICEDCNE